MSKNEEKLLLWHEEINEEEKFEGKQKGKSLVNSFLCMKQFFLSPVTTQM